MYPMFNLGSPTKISPGVRALFHFFARMGDSPTEWDGYAVEMLKAEADAWHEANQGRPRERLHFAENFDPCSLGAHLFSFGDHHVLAFGWLEDALADAAGTLKPGFFAEPEVPAWYQDLSEEEQEAAWDRATEGLTYTESGYLVSHEWHCREVTPEDVISFIYEGDPCQ